SPALRLLHARRQVGDRESRRLARHRDRMGPEGMARGPRHPARKSRQLADGRVEEESAETGPAPALSQLSQRNEGGGWVGQRIRQLIELKQLNRTTIGP